MGPTDRNKKQPEILENQERKYRIRVRPKISKNSNGGYLMRMQIEPAKIEETKKTKNEEKNTKIEEN